MLDWTIALRDIPAGGLALERTATPAERTSLAGELEIVSLENLRILGRIRPRAGGAYVLDARLSAGLVQACIVSLDPVASSVDDALSIVLRPGDDTDTDTQIEASESLLDEPDIEFIHNGIIDLGRIVYEELACRLDPYPRLEGVSLERVEAGDKDDTAHPFSKLAALKREPKPG